MYAATDALMRRGETVDCRAQDLLRDLRRAPDRGQNTSPYSTTSKTVPPGGHAGQRLPAPRQALQTSHSSATSGIAQLLRGWRPHASAPTQAGAALLSAL